MYEVMVLTGIALLVAGSLLLLVGAFRKRILWGLACLLLPPGSDDGVDYQGTTEDCRALFSAALGLSSCQQVPASNQVCGKLPGS